MALQVSDNRSCYPGGEVPTHRKLEVGLVPEREYANPFSPYPVNPKSPETEQVDDQAAKAEIGGATVTGVFTGPSGREIRMPGFWDGECGWKVRMCPTEPGRWRYQVEVVDRDGVVRSPQVEFAAARSGEPGFLRAAERGPFLRFEDGSPFFGGGINLSKRADDSEREAWAQRLQDNRMACERVWLHPHYLAIEWLGSGPEGPSFVPDAPGLGRYLLRTARAMDFTLEQAERHGIYTALCQDDMICYETLREAQIAWVYNPYQAVARDGVDFFVNDVAKRYYKRRLRYMVARWGHTTRVFTWELFNELDWPVLDVVRETGGERLNVSDLAAWHEEMAQYLRCVDPYARPVSTSTASPPGNWRKADDSRGHDRRFERVHRSMDLVSHHIYETPNGTPAEAAEAIAARLPGRAIMYGEWGMDPWGKAESAIAVPIGLHNAVWACLMTIGHMPLLWFWDQYWAAGGFAHFRLAVQFMEDENPGREGLDFTRPKVTGTHLEAYGMCRAERALVWVWDTRSRQDAPEPEPVKGAGLMLALAPGRYRVRVYDTWTGAWRPQAELEHGGGTARLDLPSFRRDAAVKVAPAPFDQGPGTAAPGVSPR
jgi:hypothetical protein